MTEISPTSMNALRRALLPATLLLLILPLAASAQIIPEPQTTIPQPTSSIPGPIEDPGALTANQAGYAYASFGFGPAATKALYLVATVLATLGALLLSGTVERVLLNRPRRFAHASGTRPPIESTSLGGDRRR